MPFGCNNVGDEAILECAVKTFMEAAPSARITVSTRDREATERRLNNVATCSLLAFDKDVDSSDLEATIAQHDVIVWCGATGLSDYPHCPLQILRVARQRAKRTILWCVGMNNNFNPAFFRVQPGKRQRLLGAATRLTSGLIDFVSLQETFWNHRVRRRIRRELAKAELVVVRDSQSEAELRRCGVQREVCVGADPALLLQPADLGKDTLPPGIQAILDSGRTRIGLCTSAQQPISQEKELAECLDALSRDLDANIVGIPMNPLTDSASMARLAGHMHMRERMSILTGSYTPSEILAIASQMDVVVSSRLHLLILASTANIPIIGIARGSKIENYLGNFGLRSVGTVNDCDYDQLGNEIKRCLAQKDRIARDIADGRSRLLQRLNHATQQLRIALQATE